MTKHFEPPRSSGYFSKIIDKSFRILNLFNPDRTSLSLGEIAKETRINKTSVFRIVETLVALGYLRKEPRTKLIKIGHRSVALSYSLMSSYDAFQIVKGFIDQAFAALNVTIDCGYVEDDTLRLLYRREVKDTFTIRYYVSSKTIYCTALGKAALANLPEEKMMSIVRSLDLVERTPYTLTDRQSLIDDLAKTRDRGYSLNNEEYMIGFISIGAPLINLETKYAMGAVSFDFLTSAMDIQTVEKKFSPIIVELTKDISKVIPRW